MTNFSKPLLLGSHMSIAGGFDKALYKAMSIGCTAIQIFTHSNRQWLIKDITTQEINQFIKAKEETNIYDIISHASYLINLGSSSTETQKKSYDTLIKEFIRCEKLKINYLVLHPGSSSKSDKSKYENCHQIIDYINQILNNISTPVTLLIENMAGQGNAVGSNFEELGYIIKNIEKQENIGICFDTCHAYAAGYDFSTAEKYNQMWKEFDRLIGINKLKGIHINDSKKPLNSRVDRHENIGKGCIPIESFKLLINDKRFLEIPKILETPKSDDLTQDKINIDVLKSLISNNIK